MVFIRHAETEANILNLWGGDYSLSEKGRKQALMVPKRPGLIVVSELKRSQETAEIAYPERRFVIDPVFNEVSFGNLENTEIDFDGELFRKFVESPHTFHLLTNGDNIAVRAEAALKKARQYPPDTIFFTHATLMGAIRSLVLTGSINNMHRMKWIENCEAIEL